MAVDIAATLDRQRARGLLGPGSGAAMRAHSLGFAAAYGDQAPGCAVDLGSGGGVPGLVLATDCWTDAVIALVDASQRRCTALELEVTALGLGPRLQVRWGRAEVLGRSPSLRGWADVVVARSFGPPAATAECAAPFIAPGGALVVSDPPGAEARWPRTGLELLGLELEETARHGGATYTRLRLVAPCSDAFPRRTGLPHRRPLF